VSSESEREKARVASPELVGRVLAGKWTIERVIGQGGMSTVYEARHRNGKLVAVKILYPHLAALPRARKRFLREGFLANQVGHSGAVSVLDDGVDDDGTVFLIMELLYGETLAKRIERQGSIPLSEVLWIMDEVLGVLAAAHEQGVVHRDLKPSNIFLTESGQVKVLDFGIARLQEEPGLADSYSTQAGATLGTPGFMASEQARGAWDEVDGRTDLWALGATMFLALTGRGVHRGSTSNELMIAAATQAVPPIGQFVRLPPGIAKLIDRALRLDPDERWSDAATLRNELNRLRREVQESDVGDEGGPEAAVQSLHDGQLVRRRSLSRHIASALAIGCIAATIVCVTWSTGAPSVRPIGSAAKGRLEAATSPAPTPTVSAEMTVGSSPPSVANTGDAAISAGDATPFEATPSSSRPSSARGSLDARRSEAARSGSGVTAQTKPRAAVPVPVPERQAPRAAARPNGDLLDQWQ
jgi:serine/threonine-protein kinase